MSQNDSVLNPGESKKFVYVGNLIPNQVNIQNLSDNPAMFTVISGTGSWRVWWAVPPNETLSIFVQWFNGIATFTNISMENASVSVGGDGIRPLQSVNEAAQITYSKEKPEMSAEPQTLDGDVFQYVLQCYDAAGNRHYYSGYYNEDWGRETIKAFLYDEAKRQGCNDCSCVLL